MPPALVAAAEAAGRGETPGSASPAMLAARLPGNGMGLAHVAQAAGHAETARRLAALGAPLDAILAYELDGADGLAGVALDEPIGRLGGTVLHEAVRIRDSDLLRAALAAGADTERPRSHVRRHAPRVGGAPAQPRGGGVAHTLTACSRSASFSDVLRSVRVERSPMM